MSELGRESWADLWDFEVKLWKETVNQECYTLQSYLSKLTETQIKVIHDNQDITMEKFLVKHREEDER